MNIEIMKKIKNFFKINDLFCKNTVHLRITEIKLYKIKQKNNLKTFSVDDLWTSFIVFGFSNPHSLKG